MVRIDDKLKESLQLMDQEEELLVAIPDISLYQPRGKYTFNFYTTYLKLHGMSFSYNINY